MIQATNDSCSNRVEGIQKGRSECDWREYFCGGCHTQWNTFDPRGVFPGRDQRWEWVECLGFHGPARHQEWCEPVVGE